jgi:hypothetical protein
MGSLLVIILVNLGRLLHNSPDRVKTAHLQRALASER